MTKTKDTLIRTSLILTLLTLFGKGFGFIREVVLAYYFGLNQEYDLFLVAVTIPVIINSTLFYLSQNYFIPLYNKFIGNDLNENKGVDFLNHSFIIFLSIGILISLFLFLIMSPIFTTLIGNDNKKSLQIAEKIYYVYLFTIPLTSALSIIGAFYQAKFDFFKVALSQLLVNIIVILGIVLFNATYGIMIIAYSTVIATFIQLFVLTFPLKKILSFRLKVFSSLKNERELITNIFIFSVIIELIGLSYTFVDRYFYDQLSTGSIAALNYSSNLLALPTNIFSFAIGIVLFSKFSFNFGKNLNKENEKIYFKSLKYNFMFLVPVTILFIFYDDLIIKILFERGQFSSSNTLMTAEILKYYAIGIPFITAYSIINKLLYSNNYVKHLLYIVLGGFIIKILVSYLLVNSFNYNALAISNSFALIFMFILGAIVINRNQKYVNKLFFTKIIVLSLIQSLIAIYLAKYFTGLFYLNIYLQAILLIIIFIFVLVITIIMLDDEIKQHFIQYKSKYFKK